MMLKQTGLLFGLLLVVSPLLAVAQGSEPETEPIPVPENVAAQPTPGLEFGLAFGGAMTLNSADFAALPGVPTCQGDTILYGGESAPDFFVGAVVGLHPVAENGPGFGFSVAVGLRTLAGSFEAEEHIGRTLLPGDIVEPVQSRYEVDVTGAALEITPLLLVRPAAGSPLTLQAGGSLALPMSLSYDGRESIASPTSARYADGRTERNVAAGDIEDANGTDLGLLVGVGYDVPISTGLLLRPSLSGRLGLSGPIADTDWVRNGINLRIDLLMSPGLGESTPLEP